ncbi:exopolysaccharide biosynthesis polyprenyl glycosylphosphotransferase [Nocardioides sp. YIM 152588]|uniref:exopolysaccharide biosynthesis polyprenyl glycosylphosphotransferase n=1 Tax=Nocardioides sp. YIM 152588 TaxID=3158259 RepID=UPI0032E3ABC4
MTSPPLTAGGSSTLLAYAGERLRRLRASHRGLIAWLPDTAAIGLGLLTIAVVTDSLSPAVALTIAVVWPALVALNGGYRLRGITGTRMLQARAVVRAGALFGLACWILDGVAGLPVESRATLALTATLTAVSVVGCLGGPRTPAAGTRVLVAGPEPEVADVLAELEASKHPIVPVAICSLGGPQHPFAGLPVTSGLGSVAEAAERTRADAVMVLPGAGVGPRELQRLGWALAPHATQLFVGTALLDVTRARTALAQVGGLRLLHVRTLPDRGLARTTKEVTERFAAVVALLLLAPVLLGLAAAIRRDSPGGALFRQERIGRNGERFVMLKFRTMRTEAEDVRATLEQQNEGAGLLFKMRQDPRVTRIGAVLRRYSLDELPQLFNVARGEMALVGPRPALPDEVDRYDHDPRRRLAVKPGLTGLWQVSGRSDLSWEESVRLDLAYVDNWSLGLDLRIVARTFGAVLGHRGAY